MDNRIGHEYTGEETPDYSMASPEMGIALGIAALLVGGTCAIMLAVRDTAFAETALWLYRDAWGAPLTGVVVFGGAISIGRYYGLKGIAADSYAMSIPAVALSVGAYGAFGGAILSQYRQAIHIDALVVTFAIVTLLTLGICAVVYSTDHSFAKWQAYSGILFAAGLVCVIIASLFGGTIESAVLIGAFAFFALGFTAELVFEIWFTAGHQRTPVQNGLGVYIAAMGVFIHVLQLVLEFMARGGDE